LNKQFAIFGILVLLLNIHSIVSQCTEFDNGNYDCTFSPNNRYNDDYDSESFTMTISGGGANQQYFINDNDICNSTLTGRFTVLDQNNVQFDVQNSALGACDYILFNDISSIVPVKNVNMNTACNSFSGSVYYTQSLVTKGSLDCSIQDYDDSNEQIDDDEGGENYGSDNDGFQDDDIFIDDNDNIENEITRQKSFEVLTEEEIEKRGKQVISEIQDFLGLPTVITAITLLRHYKWNKERLIASIKKRRPDLLQHMSNYALPLSEDIPKEILNQYKFDIPGFGMLMLAVQLPQSKNFDPTGWWLSEKFDGVRALWSAATRTFYSRWGKEFPVLSYICDSFFLYFIFVSIFLIFVFYLILLAPGRVAARRTGRPVVPPTPAGLPGARSPWPGRETAGRRAPPARRRPEARHPPRWPRRRHR